MANTFKSVTSGSIGTGLTDVYTCPASTTAIILGASMANTDNNAIGGSIKLAVPSMSKFPVTDKLPLALILALAVICVADNCSM